MKKHHLRRIISLLLCLTMLYALCFSAFADFGDFGGDDDYGWDDGGWDDDGGGWDWGWDDDGGGHDWNWSWDDDDDDYDYSWSGSSSSSRGSGGGGISPTAIVIILVILGVIFVVKVLSAVENDGGGSSNRYEDSYEYRNRRDDEDGSYQSVSSRGANSSRGSAYSSTSRSVSSAAQRSAEPKPPEGLKDVSLYRQLDPSFSASKLEQKLTKLYIRMQECWHEKDIEPLRPWFTDAYYSQLDRQLDAYRKNGITCYVERPTVLSVRFEGFKQADGEDQLYAVIKTRIVDYRLDAKGELVSGSRTRVKLMTYRWHLTRPTGRTTDAGEGLRSVSCPNCGAALSINESTKCPFCGSVVTVEPNNFVIANIEGLAQRTV